MKDPIGKDYALINVPEFVVRIIENNKTALKFNVIVGKTTMQTPIFSERLKYVEINPQWNVPDSIMRKSYIPKIKKNPGWVAAKGMELHKDSYDLKSPKVNPASVDWSKYPKDKKGYIPYKLVQVPSLKNGLGRVKFIFPNKHAVYMHDTQSKSLFKRQVRAYSHGCIRLGKPQSLLGHITTHYSAKTMPKVKQWYDSMKTHHLILNRPLQVHTAYFTAYVDEEGQLRMFHDIYGFDASQHLNF
jgi:murein L,D-transpeptidase YcbB/YkuD